MVLTVRSQCTYMRQLTGGKIQPELCAEALVAAAHC